LGLPERLGTVLYRELVTAGLLRVPGNLEAGCHNFGGFEVKMQHSLALGSKIPKIPVHSVNYKNESEPILSDT